MASQKYNIHTTVLKGILCNECNCELPPMTMAEHLDGDFPQDCPHVECYVSDAYRLRMAKRIIATEYDGKYPATYIKDLMHLDEVINELEHQYADNPLMKYMNIQAFKGIIKDRVASGELQEYEDFITGVTWYYRI